MVLVATRSPLFEAIAKRADEDPQSTDNMLSIALVEAFWEFYDRYGPRFEAELGRDITIAKRSLTAQFVERRAAGQSVDDLLEAAANLTLLEADTFAKADHDVSHEGRDRFGRWITGSGVKGAVRAPSGEGGLRDLVDASGTNGEGDRRGYRQLAVAGSAVAASGLGGPTGAALGAAGQLVGSVGPEAERVLGPHVRRTAYRYRGTERRPSTAIQQQVHQIGVIAESGRQATAERYGNKPGGAPTTNAGAIAEFYSGAGGQGLTPEQKKLGAASDYLAAVLQGRLPGIKQAQLSLASGKMPPSVGYIIDRDGDVVSEAQGFQGDHYLPFDLSHLNDLQGGAYVRTRTTGGPTDEDIYTALMTGARQLTVVSNSGVFTVKFDQDLRGGRRYSDKARQMTGRYAKLLERVGSGDHMQVEFSAEERAQMRKKAFEDAPSGPDQAQTARENLRKLEAQARGRIEFESDDDLEDDAREIVRRQDREDQQAGSQRMSRQQFERAVQEQVGQLHEERAQTTARVMRLDGEGYKAALNSLQQEFPFYLQPVQVEPWRQFLGARNLRGSGPIAGDRADLGYTRRGALAPAAAKNVARAADKERGAVSRKSTEPATASTSASAPAGAPSTSEPAAAPKATDLSMLTPDLTASVAGAYTGIKMMGDQAGEPVEGADQIDAATILRYGKPDQAMWLTSHYPSPHDLTRWLTTDASEDQLNMVAGVFDHYEKAKGSLQDTPARATLLDASATGKDAADQVRKLAEVRFPYEAPSGGDPVTVAGQKPQQFSDVAAIGNGPGAMAKYTALATSSPGLHEQVSLFEGMDNEKIRTEISEQVGDYNTFVRWGKTMLANDSKVTAPPEGFTREDSGEAIQEARGEHTQVYRDLEDSQKAWAIVRGMQVTNTLTGAEIPKVPAPAADAGPKAAGNVNKSDSSLRQLWDQLLEDAQALTPPSTRQ